MRKFSFSFKVMFCDCDPAQIVFYPKYFQWFDIGTQRMFNELGMEWSRFWPDRGISGLPIVDASAKFQSPARMDDNLEIESWVDDWKGKTFIVKHVVKKENKVIVEGTEVRVCVVKDDESPKGIRAEPMPSDVVQKFL